MHSKSSVFKSTRNFLWLCSRAIGLVWRTNPGLTVGILLTSILQAILPTAELVASKLVIDRIVTNLSGHHSSSHFWSPSLGYLILIAVLIITLGQVLAPLNDTLRSILADRVTGQVNRKLLLATSKWPGLSHFEDPQIADDWERVRRYAPQSGLEILSVSTGVFINLCTMIGLAATLAHLHPLALLLVLATALPPMLAQWRYGTSTTRHLYTQTSESRKLGYWKRTQLTPEVAKDVRSYWLWPYFQCRYASSFEHTLGQLDKIRRGLSLRLSLASAVSAAGIAGVYMYLIWNLAQNLSPVGDLVLYGGAAMLMQSGLLALSATLGQIPKSVTFLPSLFKLLDVPADLQQAQTHRCVPHTIERGIKFQDVWFTYPGNNSPVLKGISFTWEPDQVLALVGPNGAGKTTIVKLLLRLYDPQEGRILLDGVDLKDYDLDDLRSRIAAIFQDFVRYEFTIKENVAIADISRMEDQDRLLLALQKADAYKLTAKLPKWIYTRLGRELGDTDLSGGEWQKIALARVFFRDSQILILDEPTAALGVYTENELYSRFTNLTHGKMVLLISHRFSTVKMADRILFIDNGTVQEEGTHEELMRLGGEYAKRYNAQSSAYAG